MIKHFNQDKIVAEKTIEELEALSNLVDEEINKSS